MTLRLLWYPWDRQALSCSTETSAAVPHSASGSLELPHRCLTAVSLTIIWWPHTSIGTVCTVCTRLRCDLTTWLPLPEYIFCYSSASYSLSVVSFLTHFLPAATGLLVSSARHTGNGELAEPCAALFLGCRLCKGCSGVLYRGFLHM